MTPKCLESRSYLTSSPPFNRKCRFLGFFFFLNPSTELLFLSEGKPVFSKIAKNLAHPSTNTELILSLVLLLRPKLSYQHDFRQITWPLYEFPTATKNPPVTLSLYLISILWMKNKSITEDAVFRDWNTEFLSSQTRYTTTSCGWMFHRTTRYALRYLLYKVLLLFESLCSQTAALALYNHCIHAWSFVQHFT